MASLAYETKGKITRRERFLREMDAVIPWATLRVCFLQQWVDLSDPQAEDLLYDSAAMRRLARVDLGEDTVPDASTILRFRHLLEEHQLTAAMFAAVKTLPEDQPRLLTAGTIVDATIIAAPSSTKNATKTRDPEMKQTRQGKQWYVGMKRHVGTDRRGHVHFLTTTNAAQADIWELGGGRYRVNKSGTRTA